MKRLILFLVLCASSVADSFCKEKIDLLITGGRIVTMASDGRVLEDGAIAVRADRIIDIGSSGDMNARYEAAKVIPAAGKVALPGLVNTHNHAPMTLLRGVADDLKLSVWLEKHIFPLEAKFVTKEFVEWGTALACLEMIRSGTTTYADMYYFEDQVAEATERAGMRGVLGETLLQYPSPDSRTTAEALVYAENFLKRWRSNPLIIPAVAPHAPYTNTAETLKAGKLLAEKYNAPLIIHVSETEEEEKQIHAKHGMSATAWLDALQILGPRVLFAHGVWLNDRDIEIIKKRRVSISHNPESNMKLASGIAPVSRMLSAGVTVGLGTDGAASNNNLDMFEAMDFAAKLHKLAGMDSTTLPARKVLEIATIGGARALGLDREIGSLEEGKKADIILVDVEAPHLQPWFDAFSQLVYAARGADVRTSIINGRIVMLDGKVLTLDEKSIFERAKKFQKAIAAASQ